MNIHVVSPQSGTMGLIMHQTIKTKSGLIAINWGEKRTQNWRFNWLV